MNKVNLKPSLYYAYDKSHICSELITGSSVKLGIYLGRKEMYVALVKKEHTGLTLKKAGAGKLPDRFYKDKDTAVTFISEFLQDIVEYSPDVDVWCTARTDKVVAFRQLLDSVAPEALTDLVMWNFRKTAGLNPELYVCDYEVLEEVVDSKTHLAINIYSLPRQEKQYMAEIFEEAGYPLTGLTLPRAAFSNLHCKEAYPQFGSFASNVFIGERASSILIYHDLKVIVSREVKCGFNDFSDTLQNRFDRDVLNRLDDPEVLKFAEKQLSEIIDKIIHTLDFFYANYRGCDINTFFISGPMTDYPCLLELIEKKLGVELTVLSPFDVPGVECSEEIEDKSSPVATALALGFSDNRHTLNFLFTQQDKSLLFRMLKKRKILSTLFIVALVVLGIGFFKLFQHDSGLKAELAETQNNLNRYRPYKTVRQLEQMNDKLAKLKVVIEQSTSKSCFLQIVNDIANVLPSEVYVTALDLNEQNSSKKTSRTPKKKEKEVFQLTLQGTIYGGDDEISRRKIGQLMLALEALDGFEEVKRTEKKVVGRKKVKVATKPNKAASFDFSLDMKISGKLSQLL